MNGVWVSKDGTKHVIAEMEDSHLLNCIEMQKRRTKLLKEHLERINNSISTLQTERLRRQNVKSAAARANALAQKAEKKTAMQTRDGRRFR